MKIASIFINLANRRYLKTRNWLAAGAPAKTCTQQKVDKSTFCVSLPSPAQTFDERGIGYSANLWFAPYAHPFTSPVGPLQTTTQKAANLLLFFIPHLPNHWWERDWLPTVAHPFRSPRGPLQRPALSKKLINQLLLFLPTNVCK